jgi:hypothetical protein
MFVKSLAVFDAELVRAFIRAFNLCLIVAGDHFVDLETSKMLLKDRLMYPSLHAVAMPCFFSPKLQYLCYYSIYWQAESATLQTCDVTTHNQFMVVCPFHGC